MKIRKKYVLYVNQMLGTAHYGGKEFDRRLYHGNVSIGEIFDCDFSELKNNLNYLLTRGYRIICTKH